jgi:thiosulfate/3-mercaptopyruvate sulfurtransferase
MTTADTNAPLDTALHSRGYAHPEVLVSTAWVAEQRDNPRVRLLESNEDVLLYDMGHVPGAQKIDWHHDLNDEVVRDYVTGEQFQALLRAKGIDESTTVVFYGDKNNWWATYAFWVFKLFGFADARVMDGGRTKWEQEGRELVTDVPSYAPTAYAAPGREDGRIRAFLHEARAHMDAGRPMIDVRSPQEFTGERTHMPDYPQEGSADELRAIYEGEVGLKPDQDVIAYCRIGERSSHTWFVLTYLLGYDRVRNYDGSWTEWGNAVRSPIEKGAGS